LEGEERGNVLDEVVDDDGVSGGEESVEVLWKMVERDLLLTRKQLHAGLLV
jgi:hypothetical protein